MTANETMLSCLLDGGGNKVDQQLLRTTLSAKNKLPPPPFDK